MPASRARRLMLLSLSSMLLVAGCKQNDPVSQAEKAYKINGAAIPGIEETKQIAKDGFIYGLPLVMNYVSPYELFIDPTHRNTRRPSASSSTRRGSLPTKTRR